MKAHASLEGWFFIWNRKQNFEERKQKNVQSKEKQKQVNDFSNWSLDLETLYQKKKTKHIT